MQRAVEAGRKASLHRAEVDARRQESEALVREFLAQMSTLGIKPEFRVYTSVRQVYVANGHYDAASLESEKVLSSWIPTKCWNLNLRSAPSGKSRAYPAGKFNAVYLLSSTGMHMKPNVTKQKAPFALTWRTRWAEVVHHLPEVPSVLDVVDEGNSWDVHWKDMLEDAMVSFIQHHRR